MTWQKGQSGNPNGRPRKNRAMTDELRCLLQRKWQPRDTTTRELIAQQLICLALTADLDAIKYIFDRVDGKPAQSLEHSGPGGGPITLEGLLDQAWKKRRGNDDPQP